MLRAMLRAPLAARASVIALLACVVIAPSCIDSVSIFGHQYTCETEADCLGGWRCDHGICATGGQCLPSCEADPCGDDGCGGFCGPCMVHYGMNAAQLQSLLDKVASQAAFRAVLIDGFEVGAGTFFNAIFDDDPTGKAGALIDLTPEELAVELTTIRAENHQVVHLESYLRKGIAFYAVIFEQGPGPHWCALHDLDVTEFQSQYDALASDQCAVGPAKCNDTYAGCYRPRTITTVQVDGELRFSALFQEADAGHWEAQSLIEIGDFFDQRASQGGVGRYLGHMNAYLLDGAPKLSVIWDSSAKAGDTPTIDLSGDEFQAQATNLSNSGLRLRLITAWESGGEARYGASWLGL